MPSPGPLRRFRPPLGRGVRVDTHGYEGYTVPPTYDSLVAKLIVFDDDRTSALARAAQALAEFEVEGIATTLPLFREMVVDPVFRSGQYTTAYLDEAAGTAILAVRVMTETQPRAVSRRQARRAAFVLIYQLDVRAGADLDELAVRYLADTGMEVPPYTREVVEGVQRDREAIDVAVDAAAAGWTADRMGAVERAILRLATWELRTGELPAGGRDRRGRRAGQALRGSRGGAVRERRARRDRTHWAGGAVSANPALADLLERLDAARVRLGDAAGDPDAAVAALTEINELAAGRQRGARAAAARRARRARR